jgi:two-component system chemotaxis response regulator CheB
MSQARPIRVLVIDDSALVREAISQALARDPDLEVVGTACDPLVAEEKMPRLDPDVLTLDLEMPRMDGLTFLRKLMHERPMPVVVVSSLAQAGSQAALDAMEAGAVDVLAKPDGTMSIGSLAEKLAYHVKAAAAAGPRLTTRRPLPSTFSAAVSPAPTRASRSHDLIVIGGSTGGIAALRQLIPALPKGLPPIAVVQHIAPFFSKSVAKRIDTISTVDVSEAAHDQPLEPGCCLLAPGGHHLAVVRRGGMLRARLVDSPPVHHCKPAVDVLFRSAAEVTGCRTVAVLLTGMGCDGATGIRLIREAGGTTLAEHESSCVVYGMPKAAIERGVVDRVVPLPEMPNAILAAALGPLARPTGRPSV